jgi:hypothetical protein
MGTSRFSHVTVLVMNVLTAPEFTLPALDG